ncbi:32 kda heat shock protein-related [Anaeramoeba flamelloides]|uniref:32 kDa heat shock protein-related n=1 Tax=Anaeramoeba flamelloides TaxID=1746091 RepID=A0AAV8AGL5_9EUKA|nr:32 kda heat shock protein-related [Anaeramoeba flamelloides]
MKEQTKVKEKEKEKQKEKKKNTLTDHLPITFYPTDKRYLVQRKKPTYELKKNKSFLTQAKEVLTKTKNLLGGDLAYNAKKKRVHNKLPEAMKTLSNEQESLDIYQAQQMKIRQRLKLRKELKKKKNLCKLGFRLNKSKLRIFEDVPHRKYLNWLQKHKYRVDLIDYFHQAFNLFRSSYKCFLCSTCFFCLIYFVIWASLVVLFGDGLLLSNAKYNNNVLDLDDGDHFQNQNENNKNNNQNNNHKNQNNNHNHNLNNERNNGNVKKCLIKERLKYIKNPMIVINRMETKISSLFFPRVKSSFVSLMGILHAEEMPTHAVHLLANRNLIQQDTNTNTNANTNKNTNANTNTNANANTNTNTNIIEANNLKLNAKNQNKDLQKNNELINNATKHFPIYFGQITKVLILSFVESILHILITKLMLNGVRKYLIYKKNYFSFKNIFTNLKFPKKTYNLIILLTFLKSSVFISQIFNSIIGIILGLYLNFSFIWLVILFADKHTSITFACKLSWKMVHRNLLGTFFLLMFPLVINFTALSLYAVGLCATLPLTSLFFNISYFHIFGCRKQTNKKFSLNYKSLDLI